jgi:hypothetical protein
MRRDGGRLGQTKFVTSLVTKVAFLGIWLEIEITGDSLEAVATFKKRFSRYRSLIGLGLAGEASAER